jgi:hypothetical protein
MKNKVEQKSNKDEPGLHEQLSKDFIVKNMPALSRLSGANYESRSGESPKGMNLNDIQSVGHDSQQDSHRKTGIIIVSAGLLVIVILFYLAYRFLIAPSLHTETVEPNILEQASLNEVIVEPEIAIEEDEAIDNIIQPVQVIEEEIVPVEVENENNILEVPSILDSDNDGLSDVAEAFLGTDPNNPDTDGDGYSDKEEILSGYNPLGSGLLIDNSKLALFVDSAKQYALIYPQAWEVNVVGSSVLFAAPDQDFIQVSYEDSSRIYSSIVDWYEDQFSEVDVLTADRFVRSSFGLGIVSADNQFVYFLASNGSRVFVISYIPAGSSLSYLEIFQMMIATFMKV